ncbi:hypothetical protein DN37_2068 [Vibrio cholerae]|nr:hypothetical protein DN37_2068 [Vibrio cholerae]
MPTSFLLIEGYFPCKKSVICGKSGLKIVTLQTVWDKMSQITPSQCKVN